MCPSHWRARSVSATVLTTASSEPRPWGRTSKACGQAGSGWNFSFLRRMRCLDVRTEFSVINPHAVKDHADPPCQGDHGTLSTTAPGDLRGPCSRPRRAPATHHCGRGLTQSAAQGDVTGLGYPVRDIAFARLVSRRHGADRWPHVLRRCKTGKIIDGRPERQGDNCTDAPHRHKPTAHRSSRAS